VNDMQPNYKDNNKKRIVFFVKQGLDTFLGDIINGLSEDYEIKKIIITNYKQIDEEMEWSDICWFEWCDDLIVYGSKLEIAKTKTIICRIHGYEVYTDLIKQPSWENVNELIIVAPHIKRLFEENIKGVNLGNLETHLVFCGVNVKGYTLDVKSKGFNLGYLGNINFKKNLPLTLDIFKKLYDKEKRYRLHLAGQFQDARSLEYMKYFIKEHNLNEVILFDGWQNHEQKKLWFKEIDYMVISSIDEGLCYAAAEAMCCGIKPVLHNCEGLKDHYNEKYIFNDIDEAVNMIISEEYNSNEYRDFIKDNYSLERQAENIKSILSNKRIKQENMKSLIPKNSYENINFKGKITSIEKGKISGMKKKVGIVIPIYKADFIKNLVERIIDTCGRVDFKICIVNDGNKDIKQFLDEETWGENIDVLNLKKNKCFAGANNEGWKHLINKYADIEYLCTINDDTVPETNWLEELLIALDKYPKTALAAPIMITKEDKDVEKIYAGFEFGDYINPLRPIDNNLNSDKFVSAIGGFCFLGKKSVIEKIGFFDESYKNSCEDVDLCLKVIKEGFRIVVVKESRVFHYGGATRYDKNTNTNIPWSHEVLKNKWGSDLRGFNIIRPKTVVHCCAFNQEHFIKAWVKNAALYSDEIIIMYSKSPWNYNQSARERYKYDSTGDKVKELLATYSNLVVIEGEWDNETDQRNDALKYAKYIEAIWMLIVDTDEFYEEDKIYNSFNWMLKNSSEIWSMPHIQLIKKPNWSIVTPNGYPIFEFAIDLKKVNKFVNKRRPEASIIKIIPSEISTCFHLSYLMPYKKLEEKLGTFGHTNEIRNNWLKDIWPQIKVGIKNFHPVYPKEWKEIREIEFPLFLIEDIEFIENDLSKYSKKNIKLHLGCGNKHISGMLNCDYRKTIASDRTFDCSNLCEFDDNSVNSIFSNAFFEHLYKENQIPFLIGCCRVLEKDAPLITLGVPDFEVIAQQYINKADGIIGDVFDLFNVYRYTHGNPEFAKGYWNEQLHKSIFDKEYVKQLLGNSGFKSFTIFNYCYPKESIALNLGFIAYKNSADLDNLQSVLEPFKDEYINDLNEVIALAKSYYIS